MVAIDALPIDKLSPDTLLTFSLDKFKGSVTLPVLLMVVTPAVVDKLIPLPAARFPPMSPVLARLSPSGLLSPLLLPVILLPPLQLAYFFKYYYNNGIFINMC